MNSMKRNDVVNVQIGLRGEQGYRASVPAKIFDITTGEFNVKTYWFRILGLCVIGYGIEQKGDPRIFCTLKNHVGYANQYPRKKNVDKEVDALAYLGYQE